MSEMFKLFQRKEYLDYSDVLIKPRQSTLNSRKSVSLKRAICSISMDKPGVFGVPIIASNMDTTGTFEVARLLASQEMFTALHKHYTGKEIIDFFTEESGRYRAFTFVTVGANISDDITKLKYINAFTKLKLINIDIANGYIPNLKLMIELVRSEFPHATIMAGNVATADGVGPLALAGADIIKVGIGPGAQCRTRETAGVGIPQLTAVRDCVKAAKKHKVLICADGGIQEYADFSKAFVAGADLVMAGSIFAAHIESGGEIVYGKDDQKLKHIYGMSSETAMHKYSGGVADYRASEGRTSLVPLRGPLMDTVSNILGSIRSACTYTNSHNITSLKTAELIPVRNTINRKYLQHTVGD